jgi:hypothetical protein
MGTLSIFAYQEVPFSTKVFSEISISNCISSSVVVKVGEHRSPLIFPFLDMIGPPLQIIIRVGAAVEVVGEEFSLSSRKYLIYGTILPIH